MVFNFKVNQSSTKRSYGSLNLTWVTDCDELISVSFDSVYHFCHLFIYTLCVVW